MKQVPHIKLEIKSRYIVFLTEKLHHQQCQQEGPRELPIVYTTILGKKNSYSHNSKVVTALKFFLRMDFQGTTLKQSQMALKTEKLYLYQNVQNLLIIDLH